MKFRWEDHHNGYITLYVGNHDTAIAYLQQSNKNNLWQVWTNLPVYLKKTWGTIEDQKADAEKRIQRFFEEVMAE